MVSEPHNSDLFENHSILPLFPRAFRDSKFTQESKDSDDLESIHIYMKSMALVEPDKLFEEAKTFAEGSVEAPNTKSLSSAAPSNSNVVVAKGKDNPQVQRVPLAPKQDQFSSNVNKRLDNDKQMEQENFSVHDKHDASKNNDEAAAAMGKENHQMRRPDLGRKKARFSLNPNTSQPSINLEPTEEIFHLQDPEEFFSAFENLEKARKEIQRQMGGNITDVGANNPSTNTCRRRPGILGRSVSYRHSYSSMLSEIDDILTSTQEENCDTQNETTNPNVQSEENTLDGSTAKKNYRVDEVLDELIYSTSENLDGEEALSLLQESLQIKPIDLDKLCLPEFHDIEIPDFGSFGEKIPQTRESFKSNLENGLSCKTPLQNKQVTNSPVNPLTSPTPPKSPFASISLLKKRLSQKSPLNDPFSSYNIDEQPANNPSVGLLDQRLGNVDTSKESSISSPIEDVIMHENPSEPGLEFGAGLSESHADVENRGVDGHSNMQEDPEDMLQEAASNGQTDIHIEGSNGSHTNTDVKQNGLSAVEENLEDMYKEAEPSGQPDANIEDLRMEDLNNDTQLDEQNSCVDHTLVQPTATPETSPAPQHKESKIPVNAKRACKGQRRRKVLNHRQSLAEAGLLWNSGVRRSSRIKRKPLEYWKGERFLYGRVHGSLPTVIGVKYISPGKEGIANPTFRVQSYVSDDYKDLVELAALH